MIRPYKIKHAPIHKVQSFVNYIVLEVLCKPYKAKVFSDALVLPKYKSLLNVNPDYIMTPLSEAFLICKNLYDNGKKSDLKILKSAVLLNNRVRELCDGTIQPILYTHIDKIDPLLSKAIKVFCEKMYDNAIGLAPFYSLYGKIGDYYKSLVGKSSICRFCGINNVLTEFHTHRSALDHYLPRQDYPFSSVNFKNLVPLCDTCNSKYKLGENTLYKIENKGRQNEFRTRVKAFYPFRRNAPDIKVEIKFKKAYTSTIVPKDLEITLACTGFGEQIETWDRLFGIKENYLAACCTEEMYSYYEEEYLAISNFGMSHEQYLQLLENNKFGGNNFIKIPFLKGVNSFNSQI